LLRPLPLPLPLLLPALPLWLMSLLLPVPQLISLPKLQVSRLLLYLSLPLHPSRRLCGHERPLATFVRIDACPDEEDKV
jgi:hypothetical protein